MDNEKWDEITGNCNYLVSTMGRIKNKKTDVILKEYINAGGYATCSIRGIKDTLVHRIVAKEFLENKDNKRVVNHINGIKTDNRVKNLEWCTHQENTIHAIKTGLIYKKKY